MKKVHCVIKSNQEVCLKSYIDINTELRKGAGNKFFENIKNIKLVTTKTGRNYFVSKPNYHTKNFFSEKLLTIEKRKEQIFINKPVYLGLSVLEISI